VFFACSATCPLPALRRKYEKERERADLQSRAPTSRKLLPGSFGKRHAFREADNCAQITPVIPRAFRARV